MEKEDRRRVGSISCCVRHTWHQLAPVTRKGAGLFDLRPLLPANYHISSPASSSPYVASNGMRSVVEKLYKICVGVGVCESLFCAN